MPRSRDEHSKEAKLSRADARRREREEMVAERLQETMAKVGKRMQRGPQPQRNPADVWTRVSEGGRQPRLSREDIVMTAMRIADAEGFDAVSMRRIAQELDAGTMTLYHYVQTKDELLSLINDAVMGEVVLAADEKMPTDWREAISLIAHRSLDAMRRHTWLLEIADDGSYGPNSIRHFDQTLGALKSLDISFRKKFEIALIVDEYVFGHLWHSRNQEGEHGGAVSVGMKNYISDLLATDEYPEIQRMVDELGSEAAWTQLQVVSGDSTRFDRGLKRLLDGIEANLDS